jgi:hypothetical protein
MNGIASLYQMTPTGVPFRTGTRGEATTEQRYFVPSYFPAPPAPPVTQGSDGGGRAYPSGQYGSFGEGTPADTNPGWSQMTPTDQAAYYAANPTMAAVTQTGLNALGLTSIGTLQNAIDPIGVAQSHTIAQGIDPSLATPLGPTNTQQVTPIAPVQTDNLAAMNQQTQQQQTTSPAAVAGAVADAVANFADTQDAEAGQNVGVAPTAPTAAPDNAPAASAPDNSSSGVDSGPNNPFAQFAGQDNHGMFSDNSFTEAAQFHDNMMSAGFNDSTDGTDGASPSNKQGGLIKNYQQGGITSLANQVQEKGRGQDTMLVHMTPKEVGGLQALAMAHGGSLTINPQTGLPEANFLKSILPMVAGAALAATGVGAPMAALLVGGGSYLMNPKQGLMGGIMAGLGAYGGYGLGSALGMAGGAASTAGQAITPAVAQTAAVTPQAAVSATPQVGGIGTIGGGGFGAISPTSALAPSVTSPIVNPNLVSTVASPPTLGQMGQGVQNLFTKPGTFDQVVGTAATKTAPATGLGGGLGAIKTVGMAAAPIIAGMGEESSGLPVQDQFIRPFKYRARPASEEDENFRYRTGARGESTGEQRYFGSTYTPVGVFKAGTEPAYGTYAMGGDIEEGVKNGSIRSFDDEYGQDEYAGGGLTAFKAGGLQDGGFVVPADVVAHLGNGSTDAGLRLLAKTLKAKPIKGAGDGMSDSIPTTIGGKQPARVADGEAYISPEVTKKVGSERLYKMMERIRKAKTGKERQAPEINTREYVPA